MIFISSKSSPPFGVTSKPKYDSFLPSKLSVLTPMLLKFEAFKSLYQPHSPSKLISFLSLPAFETALNLN